MKSSNRVKFGIASFLGIAIVVSMGLIGYKMINNNVVGVSDCSDNRECFYRAFTDGCSLATIKTSKKTIEGDPIITTSRVSQGSEGCIVEVTVDGSQDRFGDGKTRTYTCGKLNQEDLRLTASDCKGSDDTTVIPI